MVLWTGRSQQTTPRGDADPPAGAGRGGGRWGGWVVVGGYLVAALALNWRLLSGFTTMMPPVDGNSADGDLFAWYMRYAEHAVAHGQLPALVTTALNAPRGINLMWNTSFLLPGVVLSPVTALAGPQASLNACVIAGFAGSAATMFWVLRRRRASLLAAGLGGAVFGFSPALLDSAYTHYNLQFALLVPLIADAAMTIVAGQGRTWRTGAWLGLLVSAQLFIAEEPLVDLAFVCLVMTVVLAAGGPRRAWARLPRVAAGFGLAAAVALVLCGYALWVQFAGPLAAHGSPWPNSWYVSSPSALVVPPHGLAFTGGATYKAATWEYLAYLGWPLLAVLVWAGLRYWRDPRIRALFVAGAALELLALGGGHRWLPFHWLQGLPLLMSLLPDRLPLAADAAAAAILAFGLDLAREQRPSSRARSLRGALLSRDPLLSRGTVPVAVAVLAVLPLFPMPLAASRATPVPPGWATVFAQLRLAPQARVLVVPIPSQLVPYALRWQADTRQPGQLPAGWFIGVKPDGQAAPMYWGGPPAVRQAVTCVNAFWQKDAPAATASGCASRLRTALAYWKPDAIVADTTPATPLGRFLTGTLGHPAAQSGQMLAWR